MSCCKEMEEAGDKMKALFDGLNSGDANMIAYLVALSVLFN